MKVVAIPGRDESRELAAARKVLKLAEQIFYCEGRMNPAPGDLLAEALLSAAEDFEELVLEGNSREPNWKAAKRAAERCRFAEALYRCREEFGSGPNEEPAP